MVKINNIFRLSLIRCNIIYYRGYVLFRLKIIGTQWKITEKLRNLKSSDPEEDWKITYATPIYGGWDIMVECSFSKLKDLDKIVSFCRNDKELSRWLEATTTFISTKKNYPK